MIIRKREERNEAGLYMGNASDGGEYVKDIIDKDVNGIVVAEEITDNITSR